MNVTTRIDPLIHKIKEEPDHLGFRIVNIAIPFLLMGRLTSRPTSYLLSAYQIGAGLSKTREEGKSGCLSLAHTTAYTALTFFKPAYAPLFSTVCQMLMEAKEGRDAKCAARLANHTLFLASLFFKRPEVLAASLFAQAALETKEAHNEFKKGRYLEALAKLVLAALRTARGVKAVQEAHEAYLERKAVEEYRQQKEALWKEVEALKTGLKKQELEVLLDYAKKADKSGDPKRIKGSTQHLPRSITLTPDALYIHLKKKGGMEPLGGGAFKTAYKCLKVDRHAKLMVELTVRHNLEMARREDHLAKEVGSPYINGGAELTLQYGNKLSLIQELMDIDGCRYANRAFASAADRLRVMEEVARGLGDLHAFGYTHGDLHPGNMLVNTHGEHHGKLSDLGLARKIPDFDPHPVRGDIHNLTGLVGTVCGPIWECYSDHEKVQNVRNTLLNQMVHRNEDLLSANEIADQLKECRLNLGDAGLKPLKPTRRIWEEDSSSSDARSQILALLHHLGFSFTHIPSFSTFQKLPIPASRLQVLLCEWLFG